MKEFYSTLELAELLGRSVKTIKQYIYDKKINAIKIGDAWRITNEEVERIKREGVK